LFSNLLKAAELKKFIIEINGESTYEINGTVYYSIAALEQSFEEIDSTYSVMVIADSNSETNMLVDLMDFLRLKGVKQISLSAARK